MSIEWIKVCPESWLNIISLCLWGSFWKKLVFESLDWIRKNALPMWMGLTQSFEGLSWRRNRGRMRGEIASLSLLGHLFWSLWSLTELYPWLSWSSSFSAFIIAWANSYNKFYMYYVVSLSLSPFSSVSLESLTWIILSALLCPTT